MYSFKNKKVLIFGLGILGGGVGSAEFFCREGAEVRVTDLRSKEELASSLQQLEKYHLQYTLGRHLEEDFQWADLVIKNPAIPNDSPYLQYCFKNNIPVEMEESLFLKLCPVRVIGITGTRGKSTTTTLIIEILKTAGLPVLSGGNLSGANTLPLLYEIKPDSIVVLELSSWQLTWFGRDKISPAVSVVTNIYPDHLNRYQSMTEYIEDKKNIFKFQTKDDYLILNENDPFTETFKKEAKGKVAEFNSTTINEDIKKTFQLPGQHNLDNLAAAMEVVKLYNVADSIIIRAISNFKGLPYRQEVVRVLDEVTYVNDSTSTTPIATITAIKTFKEEPIILICGGNSKNLPIDELIENINSSVKAVILLKGTITSEFKSRINPKLILGYFDDLNKAVALAKNTAKAGDTVLFSPAATSFAMYKNEFDRSSHFSLIIESL